MGETLTLQQLRNNSYHLVIRSSLLAIQTTLSLQQTMLQSDHDTFTNIKSAIVSQNTALQNTTKTLVEFFSKISSFQPPPTPPISLYAAATSLTKPTPPLTSVAAAPSLRLPAFSNPSNLKSSTPPLNLCFSPATPAVILPGSPPLTASTTITAVATISAAAPTISTSPHTMASMISSPSSTKAPSLTTLSPNSIIDTSSAPSLLSPSLCQTIITSAVLNPPPPTPLESPFPSNPSPASPSSTIKSQTLIPQPEPEPKTQNPNLVDGRSNSTINIFIDMSEIIHPDLFNEGKLTIHDIQSSISSLIFRIINRSTTQIRSSAAASRSNIRVFSMIESKVASKHDQFEFLGEKFVNDFEVAKKLQFTGVDLGLNNLFNMNVPAYESPFGLCWSIQNVTLHGEKNMSRLYCLNVMEIQIVVLARWNKEEKIMFVFDPGGSISDAYGLYVIRCNYVKWLSINDRKKKMLKKFNKCITDLEDKVDFKGTAMIGSAHHTHQVLLHLGLKESLRFCKIQRTIHNSPKYNKGRSRQSLL